MEYLTDRNEPQRRHWAVLLTITIHLAIALAIYTGYQKTPQQSTMPERKTELANP